MGATIRKRTTGKLHKFGNPVVSYQVRWREPVRDEFGAPTGQFKQTSETFDTERKAKAHLRKVEDQLDSGRGVDPSSQKAKANRPLGEYAKQYLDSLAGTYRCVVAHPSLQGRVAWHGTASMATHPDKEASATSRRRCRVHTTSTFARNRVHVPFCRY